MIQSDLLIFEGPDGCGKTTLGSQVFAALESVQAIHHGPYLKDPPGKLLYRYLQPMRRMRHPTVYDRSWLSEPIYGLTKRGKDRLGAVGKRYLERVALSRRGVVVIPDASFEACAEAYQKRKNLEYLDNEAELRTVYDMYRFLERFTDLPVVRVTRGTPVNTLLEIIEEERPKKNFGPGIGHWNPGQVTVLVGEAARDHNDADIPFIAPDLRADNCSHWLAEQLESLLKIPERNLYWINAQGDDGKPTNPGFLDVLHPVEVVAMGEVAANWCRTVARVTKMRHVPHPQYWKRFHHHQPYPLFS